MKKIIVSVLVICLSLSTTTIITGQKALQHLHVKTCEDIIPFLIQQLNESMVV